MWCTQTKAAQILGISPRTVARRIQTGEIRTRREGKNVLCDVEDQPDPAAQMADIGEHLAKLGTVHAVQQAKAMESLSAIRRLFDSQMARAERRFWAVSTLLILFAVGVGIAAGWGGVTYHRTIIGHHDQVATLESTHAAAVASLEGDRVDLRDQIEILRDATVLKRAAYAQVAQRSLETHLESTIGPPMGD